MASDKDKYPGEAYDDDTLISMYTRGRSGDMTVMLESRSLSGDKASLLIFCPVEFRGRVSAEVDSWWRGISVEIGDVFAGRSEPMVSLRCAVPGNHLGTVVANLTRLMGLMMQGK